MCVEIMKSWISSHIRAVFLLIGERIKSRKKIQMSSNALGAVLRPVTDAVKGITLRQLVRRLNLNILGYTDKQELLWYIEGRDSKTIINNHHKWILFALVSSMDVWAHLCSKTPDSRYTGMHPNGVTLRHIIDSWFFVPDCHYLGVWASLRVSRYHYIPCTPKEAHRGTYGGLEDRYTSLVHDWWWWWWMMDEDNIRHQIAWNFRVALCVACDEPLSPLGLLRLFRFSEE